MLPGWFQLVALEGWGPGEHFVGHHRQPIDIGLRRQVPFDDLFRGHRGHIAGKGPSTRSLHDARDTGHPQIDAPIPTNEDVTGLDSLVNHALFV